MLGTGYLLVTTNEDKAVRAVRDWADAEGHELLVGLSLGRSVRGLPLATSRCESALSELLPRLRYQESRANLVVAKDILARLGVAAFARRRHLPLVVWTVDSEKSLALLAAAGPGLAGHDQPARPGDEGAVRRQPVMHLAKSAWASASASASSFSSS